MFSNANEKIFTDSIAPRFNWMKKKCQAIKRVTYLNETRQPTADRAQTKRDTTLFNDFTRDNNRTDQQIYADEEDERISDFLLILLPHDLDQNERLSVRKWNCFSRMLTTTHPSE